MSLWGGGIIPCDFNWINIHPKGLEKSIGLLQYDKFYGFHYLHSFQNKQYTSISFRGATNVFFWGGVGGGEFFNYRKNMKNISFYTENLSIYIITFVCMFPIADQTAGPNGLKFLRTLMGSLS